MTVYTEKIISLDDIHIPGRTVTRILRKDTFQIEQMARDYELDRHMVRVVLTQRESGGYNIEDGRHRVIAAKMAGVGYIFAIVIGDKEPLSIIFFFYSDPFGSLFFIF